MAFQMKSVEHEVIRFNDNKDFVTIRRLSSPELMKVLQPAATKLGELFDGAVRANITAMIQDEKLIRKFMWCLFLQLPQIMTDAIAIASEAEDEKDEIALLPVDVQVAAMESIVRQSFDNRQQFMDLVKRLGDQAAKASVMISGRRQ